MKKLKLIITLFFGLSILSCSSDDNNNVQNETVKLYKKSLDYDNGAITYDKEIFYNQDNKVQSIITNDYSYKTETINVTYSGNTITSISEIDNFDNPNNTYSNVTYNVSIENNKITLISGDFQVEINHSNGYVNSTKEYYVSANVFSEHIFTRDSNLNLVSNTTGDGSTFTYSNYDSEKMEHPFGGVMEYFYSDYFRIFELKVTKNTPLTATYSNGGIMDTYSEVVEYDIEGYVIKSNIDPNNINNYVEHQYVEL